jgi:simple sugar transport system substrate-binding protein
VPEIEPLPPARPRGGYTGKRRQENPWASYALIVAVPLVLVLLIVAFSALPPYTPNSRAQQQPNPVPSSGAASSAASQAPAATVVRLSGDARRQIATVEKALSVRPRVRGLFAVDSAATVAAGTLIKQLGLRAKGFHGGGYDLLPGDLALVADGYLDFVVDQQPYVQGFAPVMQLFLTKISEGTVIPWDTETSVLLRRTDVKTFLATKSRFEGSSSRHEFPLRRV